MKSALKIASVGFIWGWLEASVLFLTLLFLGVGQAQGFLDFGPGWRAGLLSALVISFVAGAILADAEKTLKALVLATALAFGYSMVVASILSVPVSVSADQGTAELLYFGFLAPIFFFVGLVAGLGGSFFGGWLRSNRQARGLRPLPPLH